jgi:hypothetical protein
MKPEKPIYSDIRARIGTRLRSPGIDSASQCSLAAGTITLPRLAESIPWNRFLGSLNVYQFGSAQNIFVSCSRESASLHLPTVMIYLTEKYC